MPSMLIENMLMPKNLPSLLQFQCQQCRITAASSGQCLKSFLTVRGGKNYWVNPIYSSSAWAVSARSRRHPGRDPGLRDVAIMLPRLQRRGHAGGRPAFAFRCAVSCREPRKPGLGSWHLRTPHKKGGLPAGTPAGGTYSVVFCYKKLSY